MKYLDCLSGWDKYYKGLTKYKLHGVSEGGGMEITPNKRKYNEGLIIYRGKQGGASTCSIGESTNWIVNYWRSIWDWGRTLRIRLPGQPHLGINIVIVISIVNYHIKIIIPSEGILIKRNSKLSYHGAFEEIVFVPTTFDRSRQCRRRCWLQGH